MKKNKQTYIVYHTSLSWNVNSFQSRDDSHSPLMISDLLVNLDAKCFGHH